MSMSPDEMAEALQHAFQQESQRVNEAAKRAVKKTAKETRKIVQEHFTFNNRSGKYAKALTVSTEYEDSFDIRQIVNFKKNKQYLLTPLLEYGHAMKRGGRTLPFKAKAYPHMIYGQEYAEEKLPENIRKEIEKSK